MLKEFKEFAMRGNLMDMAIGIITGAAFGKIVSSFVNDVLMPPLGLLLGDADFTNRFVTLQGESFAASEHKELSVLPFGCPDQGFALRALHVGA